MAASSDDISTQKAQL